MEIKISRHAKRRIDLYQIDEPDVLAAVRGSDPGAAPAGVRVVVVNRGLSSKYGYPLKVVYLREEGTITVVSAYPVRKERSR
jgi:hypothetical protein